MNGFRLHRILLPSLVAAGVASAWMCEPRTASAQVVEVAPPALRVEVVPVHPSLRHFWMPGYWAWGPGGYVWYGGHWEIERPGWRWAHAHWAREGRRWRFHRGHFRR
jgi:hypothetical protein